MEEKLKNTINIVLLWAAKFLWYSSVLLSQSSTWRGIAFIVGLFTSHSFTSDWGEAAAFGGTLSAILKILLPDVITGLRLPDRLKPQEKEEIQK